MEQVNCPQLYQKYRIEGEIGRGASGVCYKVVKISTQQTYAMKKIHISSIKKHSTKQAGSQVAILSKVSHPHIIKLHEHFTDQNNLYIIMQHASKGDLHNIIKRRKIKREHYSQTELWKMAGEILGAIEYLHSQNIIHRDIKTLNIFMDNTGKLYLGDLGVSKILKNDSGLYSRVGTPLYLAPEIIKYEKYDFKADVWGLGCVMYQLATLNHPFEGKNIVSLGQNIVCNAPKPIQHYSSQLSAFIMQMLQKNPSKRPTAKTLIETYLKNPLKQIIPTKEPLIQQTTTSKLKNQIVELKEDRNNRVYFGRIAFDLKARQHRRHMVNNFIQEKIGFNEWEKIEDEEQQLSKNQKQKQRQSKNAEGLDETIVFRKKPSNQQVLQARTYAQITHKAQIQPQRKKVYAQCLSKNEIRISQRKLTEDFSAENLQKNHPRGLNAFSSEKKITPSVPVQPLSYCRSFNKPMFSGQLPAAQSKKTQGFSQINWAPSEGAVSSNKVGRVRPKSSIMTKDRHENTMKNIRKFVKKQRESQAFNSFVETRFLKKPDMIIL